MRLQYVRHYRYVRGNDRRRTMVQEKIKDRRRGKGREMEENIDRGA